MEQAHTEFSHSRMIPLGLLGAVVFVLALHHWYVLTEHRGSMLAMFLLPPFGMLALGGLVHPPILYSIGKYGKELPVWTKAIGYLLAIAGLGIGFYLFKFVYNF